MQDDASPNALIHEVSPYLLQHAYNPVHWLPWGDEAFSQARQSNKPVFVSIGYATCHWCHVMERESFEDAEVASFLNQHYISIKVDREEHPDVDAFCMDICQSLSGHGGWPLTIVMDGRKQPFFAGTYYPKLSSPGRLGFLDLIQRIHTAWLTDHEQIAHTANEISRVVADTVRVTSAETVTDSIKQQMLDYHMRAYDSEYGGFGVAPKFPAPQHLLCLMRMFPANEQVLTMVTTTLDAMRAGGMFDHVGFGFHRYSTDRKWHVPHFEKMLVDQAMHLWAYAEAYRVTQDALYATVVQEIVTFVGQNLVVSDSAVSTAFATAIDADADGVEGSFLTWKAADFEGIVGDTRDEAIEAYMLAITTDGNYREEATGEATGTNIPFVSRSQVRAVTTSAVWNEARKALLHHRLQRKQPQLDDKVVLDANGLMIGTLAIAAQILGSTEYLRLAEDAYESCVTIFKQADNRWLRRYRHDTTSIRAILDDHAAKAFAAWKLYACTENSRYLDDANDHLNIIMQSFADADGSLFRSPSEDSQLPIRIKDGADGATPSATSLVALVLAEMGRTLESSRIIDGIGTNLTRQPAAYTAVAMAWQVNRNYKGTLHLDAATWSTHKHAIPLTTPVVLTPEQQIKAMRCIADACELPVFGVDAVAQLIRDSA